MMKNNWGPVKKVLGKVVIKAKTKQIKVKQMVAIASTLAMVKTNCVLADTDVSVVTRPLDVLKALVLAVIGGAGVIVLAKNVMEFSQAYQQNDTSSMNSALKGIVGGFMMAGISTVLALLGF